MGLNFTVARVIPLWSCAITLSLVSVVLGARSGAENLLIAVVGVAAALFADKDRKWILFTLLVVIGSLILFKTFFSYFNEWPDSGLVFSVYNPEMFYYICQAISGATVIIVFFNLRFQQDAAVTELENRKANIQQASQLAALAEMAGGIAHEINNPLAIIQGRIALAEMSLNAPTPDKGKIFLNLKEASSTIQRISQIVKALRIISRDGGKDALVPVNIEQLLKNVILLCEEKFKTNGIQLKISKIENNIYVLGQEVSLSQVLLNLLNNALYAAMEQPEKWIEVKVLTTHNFAEIKIIDSGPGIPEEVIEKMFQPFFTTKEVGVGTGLGLSISKKIIQNHNGQLYYDASEKNTCMRVRLPMAFEINNNLQQI
jgi:signal transduction histidine kinase